MEDTKLEKIKNLLDRIIIFDDEYKKGVLMKAGGLDANGVTRIKDMLFEIESWQESMIQEKLNKDPKIFARLQELMREKNKLILDARSAHFAHKDKEQMTKILTFIDKI